MGIATLTICLGAYSHNLMGGTDKTNILQYTCSSDFSPSYSHLPPCRSHLVLSRPLGPLGDSFVVDLFLQIRLNSRFDLIRMSRNRQHALDIQSVQCIEVVRGLCHLPDQSDVFRGPLDWGGRDDCRHDCNGVLPLQFFGICTISLILNQSRQVAHHQIGPKDPRLGLEY